MSSAASVLAIVLTFDAPDHVARCVEHLGRQSTPPGAILVLDNHGQHPADEEALAQLAGVPLTVWRLPENGGPAGGYFAGLSRFLGSDFRTAWVMDDDLQPDTHCLAGLLADLDAAGRRAVVGPAILDADSGERCDGWGWVGVLIPREAVETVGVPRRDLFWCLEDQEYLRDRLPLAGFAPRRAEDAVARVTRRPDWRDDARIEGVPFQHDKPAWKYYYEVRNHTYRYLYDRPHLDRSVRLKSLANYLSAYARMVSRERSGRSTKAVCALRGLVDGATARLGRRVEPSSADRPPA